MRFTDYKLFEGQLDTIQNGKVLINTINAHSYNVAKLDVEFSEALLNSDVLIPDGISILWANRLLKGEKIKKIAGADLFKYEMERLNKNGLKAFFLGSSVSTLTKISEKAKVEYPKVMLAVHSPPFKEVFSREEDKAMVDMINKFQPDVLFIGMTAPKQEKWAFQYKNELKVGHICCIGAVFDFYAGNKNRAPLWMINFGLEWFYRLLMEPKRMWRRYLVGNNMFIKTILKEKLKKYE